MENGIEQNGGNVPHGMSWESQPPSSPPGKKPRYYCHLTCQHIEPKGPLVEKNMENGLTTLSLK